MPIYYWVVQIANALTTIVALAAALLVFWLGPRRPINLSFVIFLLAVVIWMIATFTGRLVLGFPVLGGSPLLLLELAVAGYAFTGIGLFWFVIAFYRMGRGWYATLVVGVVLVLASMPLLFNGNITHSPYLRAGGQLSYIITPTGYAFGSLHFIYELLATWVLLRQRQWYANWHLLAGTGCVLISSIASLFDIPAPIQPLGMAAATILMTYEVVKQQIFNPLLQMNQSLERKVERRTQQLLAAQSEQQRVRSELDVARSIQTSLLPPFAPANRHFTVYGQSWPAEEVGGDFFTYRLFGEDVLTVALGDVSGKGIPAALLMASVLNTLDFVVVMQRDQGRLLDELNIMLRPRMANNNMNSALLCLLLDGPASQMAVANAGLISPFLWRKGHVCSIDSYGLPLGTPISGQYRQQTVGLRTGDSVLLSSDGAVEARNSSGELFGFERLSNAFCEVGDQPPQAIVHGLMAKIRQFTGTVLPQDDITLVVVRVA